MFLALRSSVKNQSQRFSHCTAELTAITGMSGGALNPLALGPLATIITVSAVNHFVSFNASLVTIEETVSTGSGAGGSFRDAFVKSNVIFSRSDWSCSL
ncbi:hypothetical protein [Commensalibacter sp. Nvir]|uniref:hypothetical protein n=1 Tax=Commensalibacter sp. Nvir TaxID=3069817 RepID=UPI0030C85DF2